MSSHPAPAQFSAAIAADLASTKNEWGYTPDEWAALGTKKRWAIANRERTRAANKLWQERNRAHNIEYCRQYREKNRDKRNALQAAWRRRNMKHVLEYQRTYRAALRGGATPRAAMGEALNAALGQNTLYAAALAAVPTSLPRHVRDDVISSIVLAVLEGEFTQADIAKNAKRFVSAHYRDSEFHSLQSLDAIIPGTEKTRLGDTIRADQFHF